LAVDNLKSEGRADAYLVGDVMLDAFRKVQSTAGTDALKRLGLTSKKYALATVHRAENTDDPARLSAILRALGDFSKTLPVVLPLHPRARARAGALIDALPKTVLIEPPLPYGDTVALLTHSAILATDSGGLQKEAVFAGVPCVTLRDETEWTETVEAGWNRLAGADEQAIASALAGLLRSPRGAPPDYGDGDAAGKILAIIRDRCA
jgi:UDP-N-acetylglucosamine 2-epimerase